MESSQPKKRNYNKIHDKKNKKRKVCWDCGSLNHLRRDYSHPKKKKKNDFNKSRSGPKQSEKIVEFAAMIFEVLMIQDENSWWIDSGATRHICKDKACFKTYEVVEDGVFLYMGNSSKAQVLGKGSVILEFTSRKFLTLNDISCSGYPEESCVG